MLEEKTKNMRKSMGAVYAKNKTRDMMDFIGAVYATIQIENT